MTPRTDSQVSAGVGTVRPHEAAVRARLQASRARLDEALAKASDPSRMEAVLKEIDAAIEKINGGTFGVCEICKEAIEPEYLATDPLMRICLSHMSEEQQRTMERDLELAARIQQQLLPEKHLHHDGWEVTHHYAPATVVSGDYCDVISGGPAHESFFMVGDASGKGVAASLLMSQMHAIFRTLIGTLPGLPDLFCRANRLLTATTGSAQFATLVCAAVNGTGRVRIINAGHCPPLIVKGGSVGEGESTGLPLGLFHNSDYDCRYVDLAPGDFLLFYTDGLTESRNASGEQYGSERLVRLVGKSAALPSGALLETILADLSAFHGTAPAEDDLTIMVIRKL